MQRHVIWSNDYNFIQSILDSGGFLSLAAKQALTGRALVIHKTDPLTGQKKFTGVKKRLKDSQWSVCLTSSLHEHGKYGVRDVPSYGQSPAQEIHSAIWTEDCVILQGCQTGCSILPELYLESGFLSFASPHANFKSSLKPDQPRICSH